MRASETWTYHVVSLIDYIRRGQDLSEPPSQMIITMKTHLYVGLIFLMTCCDPLDNRLTIKNGSDRQIFYTISQYEDFESMFGQKLEANGIKVSYANYVYQLSIGASKKQIMMGSSKAWEYFIEDECDNKKLHIYLFDIEVLKSNSWKEVTEKKLYREKRDLTLADVKATDWLIVLD
jgi:hypothetical protein